MAGEEKYLDSITTDIYSAETTLYNTFYNIKYNLGAYRTVDNNMDIDNLHRFTTAQKNNNAIQNLGINGTASKYLYFSMPRDIGVTSGFYAYNIYFPHFMDSRFYDAKSPYADMQITLARYGSFYADVCFSRNINKNWNIGADFHLMISQKEFLEDPILDSSDRSVISNALNLFTSFKTSDDTYKVYARFFIMKHRVREPGGIYILSDLKNDSPLLVKDYLDQKNASKNKINIQNRLLDLNPYYKSNPETVDMRQVFHLYHQLEIVDSIWVYHELEIGSLSNYFEYRNREDDDKKIKSRAGKGGIVRQKALRELDENEFTKKHENKVSLNRKALGLTGSENVDNIISYSDCLYMQNELGIKGKIGDFFYMPYYRLKNSKYDLSSGKEKNDFLGSRYLTRVYHEHYIGLYNRYDLKIFADDYLHAGGEYLFKNMYKVHVGYVTNVFSIEANRVKYNPSMLAQEYHGYGRDWEHDFKSPTATQFRISAVFGIKWVEIKPNICFTIVENPIYFRKRELSNDAKKAEETLAVERYLKGWKIEDESEDSKRDFEDLLRKNGTIEKIVKANPTPICEPTQLLGKNVSIGTIGTDLNFKFGPIRWHNTVIFSKELGIKNKNDSIFRFPSILVNTMLFYTRTNQAGNSSMNTGIDVHYKSEYKADGYDPVLQQFFVQNDFMVDGYPVIDLFFNFKIDSFNMFLKLSHINNFLHKTQGYFNTPFYPGQSIAFDIGIRWSFFD